MFFCLTHNVQNKWSEERNGGPNQCRLAYGVAPLSPRPFSLHFLWLKWKLQKGLGVVLSFWGERPDPRQRTCLVGPFQAKAAYGLWPMARPPLVFFAPLLNILQVRLSRKRIAPAFSSLQCPSAGLPPLPLVKPKAPEECYTFFLPPDHLS